MKVKVYSILRRSKFGYEYHGNLIYDKDDFFIISIEDKRFPVKKLFHKSAHRYEEVFEQPVPIGSYVLLTNKHCPQDPSYQDEPHEVLDYVKINEYWNIKFKTRITPSVITRPIDDYIIIKVPQEAVLCFNV